MFLPISMAKFGFSRIRKFKVLLQMRMKSKSLVISSIISFIMSSQSPLFMPNIRFTLEDLYGKNLFNMTMVMINHGALLVILMLSQQGMKKFEESHIT